MRIHNKCVIYAFVRSVEVRPSLTKDSRLMGQNIQTDAVFVSEAC